MGLRVLFVIDSLGAGGAERVVLTLAQALADAGHRVTVVSADDRVEYAVPAGIQVHSLGFRRSARLRYLRYGQRLRRLVASIEQRDGPFDLVTAHLQKSHRLCRAAGLKQAVFCVHSTISEGSLKDRGGLRRRIKRARVRRILSGHRVVAVSQGIRDDLIREIGVSSATVRTIYNPVDFGWIRSQAASASGTELLPDPYVVHVGRLAPVKRHDLLLRAFQSAGIEDRLVLVGEGPERTRIEALVRDLGLTDRVTLTGFLENPYPVLAGARACILSSDYEGLSMVLIEALGLGVPVVSTDCRSGPREILGAGLSQFLAPTGDWRALGRALSELLREGDYRDRQLEEASLERFEVHTVAQQYLALAPR
jgi:glycosyltransferase involved in cell wall biosynthesis